MTQRFLHSEVRASRVIVSRSSLELFSLPYTFTQAPLLTPDEFGKAAEKRRNRHTRSWKITTEVLEALHRHRILIPLIRVDQENADSARRVDVSQNRTTQGMQSLFLHELLDAASRGNLADPVEEPFQPWSDTSYFLYSHHQLLALEEALYLVRRLRLSDASKAALHLADEDLPNEPTISAFASWRSLAIVLSVLDWLYWPFITHEVLGDLNTWRSARLDFDPTDTLTWLGCGLDDIVEQVSTLKFLASCVDDTGDFYDAIRRGRAEAWQSLRGDALVAMGYRQAAEMLDQFVAHVRQEDYPRSVGFHETLDMQNLGARPKSLDGALSDLHLSPYPALILGVEGATEYLLVPRVMELLGIDPEDLRIQIVDYGGTDRDLTLLARYAVAPLLGKDHGQYVEVDRRPARFLILADPEKKYYRSAAARRNTKRIILDAIVEKVPRDLRKDLVARQTRLVEIFTWKKWPFEFDHFSDTQLANAMQNAALTPHPGGLAGLTTILQNIRQSSRPDKPANVEKAYWNGCGITKVALADELWPLLERRIKTAIKRRNQGPPIMKGVLRAYGLAHLSLPRGTVLRRYP